MVRYRGRVVGRYVNGRPAVRRRSGNNASSVKMSNATIEGCKCRRSRPY